MSIIDTNIYLGDLAAGRNEKFITKSKITHVLIVAKSLKQYFPEICTYKQFPIADNADVNILEYFVEGIKFMDEALKSGGGVLVHCLGGVSRSATIVIAYIMVKERKTFSEAQKFVQKKRSRVNPNTGFATQLELFETCLKYYFDNTKGEKIDFPFLIICVTSALSEFEKRRKLEK